MNSNDYNDCSDPDSIDIMSDVLGLIKFKKLRPDAIIPKRGTPYSAGFDLYAVEDTTIYCGIGNTLVKTGIAVQMPLGHYGRIAIRSGLAVKEHLCVSAGVIDLDYTGEIGVVVFSSKLPGFVNGCPFEFRSSPYTIKAGERFAQLIVEKISTADAIEVKEFSRNYGQHDGFGSTGKK